ncbi:MAG: sterol desaturase family protein [Maricaulaceae bacterium]
MNFDTLTLWITTHEGRLRLCVFIGLLMGLILLEALFPRKARTQKRPHRWATNLLMVVIDSVVLRLVFPIIAVGFSMKASASGWGVFNLWAGPLWLELALAVILLDGVIYLQHVLSHRVPFLWALHKVHHTDRDLDVTSALRFHPVEILFSMAYKIIWVLVLGPSVAAVIIFEVILNGSAMFNHANLRLPLWMDKILRPVIVTPDMHRVHHSVIEGETNRNYGFFLSVWDRLFRTYRAQPEAGHDGMTLGLAEHQHSGPKSLLWSLALPFGQWFKQGHEKMRRWL